MKEQAVVLSDFKQNIEEAILAVDKIDDFEGSPSYKSCVTVAQAQFEILEVQDFIQKEVLIINSSISICDHGDI